MISYLVWNLISNKEKETEFYLNEDFIFDAYSCLFYDKWKTKKEIFLELEKMNYTYHKNNWEYLHSKFEKLSEMGIIRTRFDIIPVIENKYNFRYIKIMNLSREDFKTKLEDMLK